MTYPRTAPLRRSHRLLAALVALLAGLGMLGVAPAALAAPATDSLPARALPATTPKDCLAAGKVWVYVTYSDGSVLANTCVTEHSTGLAALKAAGVTTGKDSKGFVCSLDQHPNPCPKAFNGQYWNYYSSTDGKKFTYYQTGADASKPKAGSIEAWCYNKKSEKSCTPPTLSLTADVPEAGSSSPAAGASSATPSAGSSASASSSAAPASSTGSGMTSGTVWGIVVVIAIIVIGAIVFVVVRRRKQ